MTDQYAVFGNPIAHSKSPLIHQAFAEQCGEDLRYEKQLVPVNGFKQALDDFCTQGGKGLNITVPFKEQAYQEAQSLSKRARQAGAVNTLIIHSNGEVEGDNTDGIGMVRDICENQGWEVEDQVVLILGAGGAVRGVLGPLLALRPRKVFICNRTLSKAQQLATAFAKEGNIEALAFDQLPLHAVDLIINGTSASLAGEVPSIPTACVAAQTHCYDMMYSQEATAFLQWAKENGAGFLADGLGMLVEQAAEAFYLWRGVKPATAALIKKLRG
jgi:shikimate dehydrogenase